MAIVDDEPAIREICRLNLELSGLDVVEAANGTDAAEVIEREHPDLVLLDVMMPGLDGWHVAERLAASPDTRDLPVVFLSARATLTDLRRGYELGAVGYVVKPFDPIALADLVRDILDRIERGEREELRRELLERA